MIPYADFLYFGVLLYVAIPALVLGFTGWLSWRWILLATVLMLAVQYGGTIDIEPQTAVREIWIVAGYALFEWMVALAFLRLRSRTNRRALFYGALALALLPLVVAKFLPLFAPRFLFGFLGISYVTFRALDVIFCVQDRLITALPPAQFLAYLFFFATISSGPIDRYRRFEKDWKRRRTRAEFLQDLDGAVHRIFTGFFYKFILAALVKQHWMDPAAIQSGFWGNVSYMYAYSFYLFFDFAGYSAFAIGLSYLFGIHTPENFNRPFLARNIRDFWNRWHISLSWWFRDHVYMRFVMAATKGRWFKDKYVASYLGFLLAFGLMGLWHGTTPNYMLYGLYHGTLLASYDAFSRWSKQRKLWGEGRLWHAAEVITTFNCVCFGFLLFSGHLGSTWRIASTAAFGPDAHAYEGAYEAADCSGISGWAWDARNPDSPVNVEIYDDQIPVATVAAELFRYDLANKGNGGHAFVYPIPDRLRDGSTHSIRVRIAGAGTDLGGSPRPITCVIGVEAMNGYEGFHATADCREIAGSAWDVLQPNRPVGVDIYDGRTLLATVSADQFRPWLVDLGNGKHGFVYATPVQLKDGRSHSVTVRISGTNVTLRNSPRVVTCPSG